MSAPRRVFPLLAFVTLGAAGLSSAGLARAATATAQAPTSPPPPHRGMPPRLVSGAPRSGDQIPGFPVRDLTVSNRNLSMEGTLPQNEPSLAQRGSGSTATLFAAWNDYGFNTDGYASCGFTVSRDGGATWTPRRQIPRGGTGPDAGDPVTDILDDGTLGFFQQSGDFAAQAVQMYYTRSTNGGDTWSTPVRVSDNSNFQDREWSTHDGNNVYCTFTTFNTLSSDIRFRRSTNGGISFSGPSIKLSHSPLLFRNGAVPCVGPNHSLYVVWGTDERQIQYAAYWTRSLNGGQSFITERKIDNQVLFNILGFPWRVNFQPSVAINRSNGHIFVVWNDGRWRSNKPDILLAKSVNNGTSWTFSRVTLAAPNLAQNHDFFMPWISLDQTTGRLDVIYYDSDPSTYAIAAYVAHSTNEGASWTFEQASDFNVPVFGGSTPASFIGDMLGITSEPTKWSGVWTWTPVGTGDEEIYFARSTPVTGQAGSGPVAAALPEFDAARSATARRLAPISEARLAAGPNPFRGSLSIRFDMLRAAPLQLRIHDMAGRLVRTLVDGGRPAGTYTLRWDGTTDAGERLPRGVYELRIHADGYPPVTRRVTLTR